MKQVASGVWVPDDESDSVILSAGDRYQHSKLAAAIKYCRKSRRAVDVGAHCGLWTAQLGAYFEQVECFEPVEQHIECWKRNAGWKLTCHLHPVALGEKEGTCGMKVVEKLSGRSHVNGGGDTPMKTLDSYGFENVDFIKLDCEGYEYFALKGGEETLLKCKPVVIVEQKPHHHEGRYGLSDTAPVDYLKSLGMEVKQEIVGDFICVFPETQNVVA